MWRASCGRSGAAAPLLFRVAPSGRLFVGRGWPCRCPALLQNCGLQPFTSDAAFETSTPTESATSATMPIEPSCIMDALPSKCNEASGANRLGHNVSLVPELGGPPLVREFDLRQSFFKYPFRREVQTGLMRMGVSVPTRVQDLAIPKLLGGVSTFMLAQTGTGKTLAYVLPIVHMLLESNSEGFYPMSKKPRAIIVQPTRELALQTIKIVRQFPIRSMICAPGCSFIKEAQALYAGIDIIVATPYRLCLHLGKENMVLSQVRHLVLDEADTLCDTFYEKDTRRLLRGLAEDCPKKPQVVIVGATRTGAVSSFLKRNLNDTPMLEAVTTDAHMTPPQVEQVFHPTRGKRRVAVLWEIMNEVPAVGRKTLIFTNRVPTCKSVTKALLEHGVSAVSLHGNMNVKRRKQVWNDFTGSAADVMVCTNLASRGLDFQNVHHVVMFDFPHNMADYLHRVGRTARGGRAGRVTTITPRRFWPFVTKIQEASKAGKPIQVRHATKNMKKILALQQYEKIAVSGRLANWQKRRWRKRLGLPPARHLGSAMTKQAMKNIMRRAKAVKKVRFLQMRGILKKDHGMPQMQDTRVEATEAQTVSTLVRARDGLLQVIPKRRRQPSTGVNAAPTMDLPLRHGDGREQPRDAVRRRRRTIF